MAKGKVTAALRRKVDTMIDAHHGSPEKSCS